MKRYIDIHLYFRENILWCLTCVILRNFRTVTAMSLQSNACSKLTIHVVSLCLHNHYKSAQAVAKIFRYTYRRRLCYTCFSGLMLSQFKLGGNTLLVCQCILVGDKYKYNWSIRYSCSQTNVCCYPSCKNISLKNLYRSTDFVTKCLCKGDCTTRWFVNRNKKKSAIYSKTTMKYTYYAL